MTKTETTPAVDVDAKHADAARKAYADFLTADHAASKDAIDGVRSQAAINRELAMAKIGDAAGVPCNDEGKAALAKVLESELDGLVASRRSEILTFAVAGSKVVAQAAKAAEKIQAKCEADGVKSRNVRHALIRIAQRNNRKLPSQDDAVKHFTALYSTSKHETETLKLLTSIKGNADKLAKANKSKYEPLQTLAGNLIGEEAAKAEAARKSRREAFRLWVNGPAKPKAKASAASEAGKTAKPSKEVKLNEIEENIFSGFMTSGQEDASIKAALTGMRNAGMKGLTMAKFNAYRKRQRNS